MPYFAAALRYVRRTSENICERAEDVARCAPSSSYKN